MTFLPHSLKGCGGVFDHGVRMGRWRHKACISQSLTPYIKMLILGRDIGWGVGVQRHVVTLI